MIDIKFKKIYDEFIDKYEEIHPNPWHTISKDEVNNIYNELVNKMDINTKSTFTYFMNYIIKRISGSKDAHTRYFRRWLIPISFKIIDGNILVNSPDELFGSLLMEINGISINDIIDELDEIITYGTLGRRRFELEKALFNFNMLLGLPSLRGSNELVYTFKTTNNEIVDKHIEVKSYNEGFDYNSYMYGSNNGTYKFIDNTLVYILSSLQDDFKEKINNSIINLNREDLSKIDRIIIDLQGNWGGNSSLADGLIDFVKNNSDKELFVLTDYRVFSAGRHVLNELKKIGAIVIGEEISTPMNCYGNNTWVQINDEYFSISEWYFQFLTEDVPCEITSKEEYKKYITDDMLEEIIFKPDIYVSQTYEDYLKGVNTILEYGINYNRTSIKRI